jgi:N-acetylglucosaminyl-diphospho-decaprenol L-rhamnosyltransferase
MNYTQVNTPANVLHQNSLGIPDLSIVLVCWNNKKYIEPCLHSIFNGGLQCSYDVIVVDNGSVDGSQALLRKKFPQVKIIQNDQNVGLGRASNQGIEATQGKYVLLLNNDTLVNGHSLDAMIKFLNGHLVVGAVGGKLLNPDGSIQSCYYEFSTLTEEFLIATRLRKLLRSGYPANIKDEKIRAVDWISSACLMLRREALNHIGLLDEEYFIYSDEADLQYRLKKAGWQVYYLPDSTTIHYGGRSMDRWRKRKMVYRGKMLFYRKHYGIIRTSILRLMLAVLSVGKLMLWGIAYLFPYWNDLAEKELQSNLEVIHLCLYLN